MGGTLLWFRLDLRLSDHPALHAALERGRPIIPVFIWAPEEERPWAPGAASRWWLHHSLASLDRHLRERGSRLLFRSGPTLRSLERLCKETGADAVYYTRRYEPAVVRRDRKVNQELDRAGIECRSFSGHLLLEPESVRNQTGKPFRVFTPFWNSWYSAFQPSRPLPQPKSWPSPVRWPASEQLSSFHLRPSLPWAEPFHEGWSPGEEGASRQAKRFLDRALASYPVARDVPASSGSSRLSPHLHFGEISVRALWLAAEARVAKSAERGIFRSAEVFRRELAWREFAYHLLHHFPLTPERPLSPSFEYFPWRKDPQALSLWQKGKTGFPIVDAGMRELWATGWMHNRVRMITGSFLVKDLRLSWIHGARWFWDTLVDADLANNTLGWQWVAGCGADAAPYFRVFNPELQREKFDPKGRYIRRWIPELRTLAYPVPCVDHAKSREAALVAFRHLKTRPDLQ